MKRRTEPHETVARLTRDQHSTVPSLSAPRGARGRGATGGKTSADLRRRPEGAPTDGIKKARDFFLRTDRLDLHLVDRSLGEADLAEDNGMWFDEAPDYVDRTADFMDRGEDLVAKVPWVGADLRARLERTNLLDSLEAEALAFAQWCGRSKRKERADLIRMCDIVVRDAEATLGRPTLEPAERERLTLLCEGPVRIWRRRQERIRLSARRTGALRRQLRDRPAAPPADPMAGELAPAAAPRRGRRRDSE